MSSFIAKPDPKLDLVLDRVVDVPPALVWKAWTDPEHIKHWFVPRPWTITECELDLRPGGLFRSVMRSPDGQEMPNNLCVLEVVPEKRLVFTDALASGYRPAETPFMTAVLELRPEGAGTRYVATALHNNETARKKHEEMGFMEGWGTVLNQLVDYVKQNLK